MSSRAWPPSRTCTPRRSWTTPPRTGWWSRRTSTPIAVAGVGHRYPALEVYSRSRHHLPWDHTPDELRGFSDLLHALHAATGIDVPTNEEWHYRPPSAAQPMPWHVVLKWRVSTLAGFEGGTKINVNTIDPYTLRDRTVAELATLRADGRVAAHRDRRRVLARPRGAALRRLTGDLC